MGGKGVEKKRDTVPGLVLSCCTRFYSTNHALNFFPNAKLSKAMI